MSLFARLAIGRRSPGLVRAVRSGPAAPVLRRLASSTSKPAASHANLAALLRNAPSHSSLALLAPSQGVAMTYNELDCQASALATALCGHGYSCGDGILTDLPNTAENLLLQLACARLGVIVVTAKDPSAVKSVRLKGVATTQFSDLSKSSGYELPPLLIQGTDALSESELSEGALVLEEALADSKNHSQTVIFPPSEESRWHAQFGSALLTHQQLIGHGKRAMDRLSMGPGDRVCISITLCHAFGIGSAVCSALLAGATVVLPAVGGIRGCGNPAQRAEVTSSVLQTEKCTLLFADSHTLKALPQDQTEEDLPLFRGGVVKIGSGADFLEDILHAKLGKDEEPRELKYANKRLVAFGKKSDG